MKCPLQDTHHDRRFSWHYVPGFYESSRWDEGESPTQAFQFNAPFFSA